MKTKLMIKLFSDSTPDEFKELVNEGFDEAINTGDAVVGSGDDKLEMKAIGDGKVEITDAEGEVTIAKENPEDHKLVLESPEKPAEEQKTESEGEKKISQCPETGKWFIEGDETPYETEDDAKAAAQKAASETAPDVVVDRPEGEDGKHTENTVPNVEVTITPAITDEGKAGMKQFSIRFFGNHSYSSIYKTSKAISRAFSEANMVEESLDKSAETALKNAEPSAEEKQFSEEAEQIEKNAQELADAANDLAEKDDVEAAKEVKAMCDKIMSQCAELEEKAGEKVNLDDVKTQCKSWSDAAEAIIAKAEEKPAEDPEKKPEDKPAEKTPEELEKEAKEAKAEELNKKAEEVEAKAESVAEDDEKAAEELKTLSDELKDDIQKAEAEGVEVAEELKNKAESFSQKADAILKKNLRVFSESVYMKGLNPAVKVEGTQKVFSKPEQRESLNPYLFK